MVMLKLHSPFLVNLGTTYQDKEKIYFLLEPCLGGDMLSLLKNRGTLKENDAKFYAACVLEGLSYLHSIQIIYRDLKPENLVIDRRGYIKLADFGFSKKIKNKTFTFCGTPDYIGV